LVLALLAPMAAATTEGGDVASFAELVRLVRSDPDPASVLEKCGDTVFTLSKDQRVQLRKAGASPALIEALQTKRMALDDVRNLALILDCSGSMQESLPDDRSKMDAAKAVLTDLVKRIPDGMSVSFTVYGHNAALKCQAVEVKRPLGPVDSAAKAELARIIAGLQPQGATPIAAALRAAGGTQEGAKGLSQVVLITDGMETCHGNPESAAESLALRPKMRRVEVVGLGMKSQEKVAVTRIARRGRGKHYDTQTATELAAGLAEVVPVVPQTDRDQPKREAKADDADGLAPRVRALVESLQDEHGGVREDAARSLGKLGARAKGSVPALVKLVADERTDAAYSDGSIRDKDAALDALKALAPDKVESALIAASKAKSPTVKVWADKRLGDLEDAKP
jgi:Mg-chelatase subunit ChlD